MKSGRILAVVSAALFFAVPAYAQTAKAVLKDA
jgi:hypothetical protein